MKEDCGCHESEKPCIWPECLIEQEASELVAEVIREMN